MTERDFVVKPLPAVRLAERSGTVVTQPEVSPLVGPLFDAVAGAVSATGADLRTAVAYYEMTDAGVKCHAGFEYDGQPADGFEIGELPAVDEAVTLVHLGSMTGISASWMALYAWLDESGFAPTGPGREIYLESSSPDQDTWVTELQQPFVHLS